MGKPALRELKEKSEKSEKSYENKMQKSCPKRGKEVSKMFYRVLKTHWPHRYHWPHWPHGFHGCLWIVRDKIGDCGFQVIRDFDIFRLGIPDDFAAVTGADQVAALTACPFGSFKIGKTVTDHERPFQIHFEFGSGVKDHAWFRFAAFALSGKFRMVRTVVKSVNSGTCCNQQFLDSGIDFVNVGLFVISACDTGLIGHDNHQEPMLAQFAYSINHAGNKRDFLRLPEVVNFFIDDAVAIKKTGFIHRIITFTNI